MTVPMSSILKKATVVFLLVNLLLGSSACRRKKIPVNLEGCDLSLAMVIGVSSSEWSYPEVGSWQALSKYVVDNNLDFTCLRNTKLESTEDFSAAVNSQIFMGNDLVVVADPIYGEAIKTLAEENPEQKFCD